MKTNTIRTEILIDHYLGDTSMCKIKFVCHTFVVLSIRLTFTSKT